MLKSDFYYELPQELIAQEPCIPRDAARLLCLGRNDGCLLYTSDIVSVSLSDRSISLICFNEADQFEAIDKKLKGR